MKNKIKIKCKNLNNLNKLIFSGFKSYSINYTSQAMIASLYLKLRNNSILNIYSETYDIGPWDELGYLVFEIISVEKTDVNFVKLDKKWLNIDKIEKLIYEDEDISIESGLVIKTGDEELIIVSSVMPYNLELKAKFLDLEFKPECYINRYERVNFKIER